MKILAVDTATPTCSVAVTQGYHILGESTCDNGQTHSKHLMEMIDTALRLAGITITDLDGLAVTRGPGSFTGLRIGISTVKGLASATGKPVVGISSLEALAVQAVGSPELICPMIDARRGEVYVARYRRKNGKLNGEADETVSSLNQAVFGINEPTLFIGSGALFFQKWLVKKMDESAYFTPGYLHTIRASSVAFLSLDIFKKKDYQNISLLSPHYLRKSDAEINLAKKKP